MTFPFIFGHIKSSWLFILISLYSCCPQEVRGEISNSILYFWVSIYAEWQKVIIDAATKKIIIQSWDQNLDLDALKAASENASGSVSESSTGSISVEILLLHVDNEVTTWGRLKLKNFFKWRKNISLYAELEWGEEIDKALYWMYNNGLTKYDNLTGYRPDDPLLREEAAKIIGQAYVIFRIS